MSPAGTPGCPTPLSKLKVSMNLFKIFFRKLIILFPVSTVEMYKLVHNVAIEMIVIYAFLSCWAKSNIGMMERIEVIFSPWDVSVRMITK